MDLDIDTPAIDGDDDILNDCGVVEIPPPPALVQSIDALGPRLMITQIVTENFKSYGGTRLMGPFHKNFSCIIGPNGSGKSNVIDSMLFVFGYRASKVRSKKLSQLIHQSELIPNAPSCMVAVHFQKIIDHGPGATDYEIVPDSQFIISRRAYRDNSSSYWIDNTRAVYRDVANLLRSHGVDLDHNRFLILQGEVEQIALMKPKAPTEHEDGFLEYLEDIIGSSRFKNPLNIYTNRIERLNDLRLEKLARVKAIEKEKDELEGVRNEAVSYLRLVNQLISLKNILYQRNLAKERTVVTSTQERLNVVQSDAQALKAQIQEKTKQLSRLEAERDELTQNHTDLQIRHRNTKAKFSEYEAEDGRLRDEHAHTKAAGRRLAKAIQVEKTKLEELERLPSEADSRREEIQRQLRELEETRKRHEEAYKETVDSLEKETMPLRMKVEASEAELAPLQTEADELASKLTLERQQYDLVMAGQRRELERCKNAREGAENVKKKLTERENELQEARKQLIGDKTSDQINNSTSKSSTNTNTGRGKITTALASATRDLNQVKTHEAQLTEQLTSLRRKLTESKSAFQASNSRSRVLNALLEAKISGTLPGIIGRLGDLGAIPSRYDIAVSTACAALDNIVTDTMDTAQKAVTFLKQNNLGQATFIALDKMSKWAEKAATVFNLPKEYHQVQRLFDLVETIDSAIKPAFYYALRDTLVTTDLDSATKVAFGQKQRYRVVTLQGHLIEASGAMSGGGSRPLSGRIRTDLGEVRKFQGVCDASFLNSKEQGLLGPESANANDLASMEKQLIQGDAELGRLRDSRSRLEELVTRMARQLEEAERTVKRCEIECTRLRTEYDALSTEAKQAELRAKSTGPSDVEKQKIEKELAKLEKLVQQKCSKAAAKKEESDKLKAQLLDVGTARLTAVRSRLDAIEKKTKETNDQLTKLEVGVKTAARNQQKAEAKLKGMESELEITKNKVIDLDAKLKQIEEDARACMTDFQKIQTEVEELQKSKDENQSKFTELESNLVTIQKEEATLRRQIVQLAGELSQATTKARQWERELRGLKLHHIDDDDDDVGDTNQQSSQTIQSEQTNIDDVSSSQQLSQTNAVTNNESVIPVRSKFKRKSTDLPVYSPEALENLSVDSNEMQSLEKQINNMAPNMTAIEEYRRKAETYLSRVSELNHITSVLGDQRKLMDEAKSKRLTEFLDGFHSITNKLKEMYQMITQDYSGTMGTCGDAELELIDSLDPFSEGIVFSVRPPKKSWKNIANLSGGEKTLSSLALVFALHHYKPTPLYVMDEIDAALDFKNVSIVGNYLKERTKNAQFIVISLRNNMFELSDRLVGIYKTFNITKTITLDPSPLTNHLRNLIIRVATVHGREKDLQQEQQHLVSSSQPTVCSRNQITQPVHLNQGETAENPIKLAPDSPVATEENQSIVQIL